VELRDLPAHVFGAGHFSGRDFSGETPSKGGPRQSKRESASDNSRVASEALTGRIWAGSPPKNRALKGGKMVAVSSGIYDRV